MDSGPQHAPALQRLDDVAIIRTHKIAMPGLLQVPPDRRACARKAGRLSPSARSRALAAGTEKYQIGKARRHAHPFQPRRGRAIARTIGGGHPHAMLDPRQRHQLLLADRTRDPEAVTAVIAGTRNKD